MAYGRTLDQVNSAGNQQPGDYRILREYGYPPDEQEKATLTVLEEGEVLSEGWAVA